tara:strand:- start:1511 stop:1732 length:222 start_codon:yes stop_codon:yes gene_type:complete
VLKWIKNSFDNGRIQRLEAEVADLRREQKVLRDQNEAMVECVENISKYEKQLVEAVESLTKDLSAAVKEMTGE